VGVHDNVFDLGGTSFDIIKINKKLAGQLAVDLPLVKMFKYPTIRLLANYLAPEENHHHGAGVNNGENHKETLAALKEDEGVMAGKIARRKVRLREKGRRLKHETNNNQTSLGELDGRKQH